MNMFIPTVAPPMDKKTDETSDAAHYLRKWVAGDLLCVSRTGTPHSVLKWLPEGIHLLYLGEWGTLPHPVATRRYFVKCLYNGDVIWVETSRLRLVPRGSKNLVQK